MSAAGVCSKVVRRDKIHSLQGETYEVKATTRIHSNTSTNVVPSPNPNAVGSIKMGTNNNHSNNWILPPNYKLSPRIDIWSLLSISSCCAVSSIGAIHSSLGNNGSSAGGYMWMGTSGGFRFSSSEQFALSASALSFIISFVMAIGLRYAPLRSSLTTNIYPPSPERLSTQGQKILSSFNITYELLILTVLSIFWMVSMAIICNDASYYNVGGGNNSMVRI